MSVASKFSNWPVIISAAAVLMITMGARQSSGLFVLPLYMATGLGIVKISFALAVAQLLWGAVQPFFGAIADKWGSYKVLVFGAILLAAGLGFTWLATVPPTAGIVGKLFDTRYLATLFGLTLLTHPIGGFLGAWLGGLAMDHHGNYQWMWYADIALASLASLVNLSIREATPVRRTINRERGWVADSGCRL